MTPGLRSLEYEERLRILGIWSLEERRNRADLLEVYMMKSGFCAIPLDMFFFEIENQQRTRGHTWKIVKQRIKHGPKEVFLLRTCCRPLEQAGSDRY